MTSLRWGRLAAVAAAITIVSAPWALAQPWLIIVFKPMATLAIIAHAWGRGHAQPGARRGVLLGLGLSLVGDFALIWASGFLIGLVAFLLAHLVYLSVFARAAPVFARRAPFVAYGLVGAAVLTGLWPGIPPGLRAPVVAYVFCLCLMAAQAAVVWLRAEPGSERRRAAGLALGAACFVASDALLAIDRFAVPLPAASIWVLTTYWWAQWRIASWLRRTRPADATALPPQAGTAS